jgi:hypothetical protein
MALDGCEAMCNAIYPPDPTGLFSAVHSKDASKTRADKCVDALLRVYTTSQPRSTEGRVARAVLANCFTREELNVHLKELEHAIIGDRGFASANIDWRSLNVGSRLEPDQRQGLDRFDEKDVKNAVKFLTHPQHAKSVSWSSYTVKFKVII